MDVVQTESFDPDDHETIERHSARYLLPHLADFVSYVAKLLSGEDEAYGRRYQREIIAQHCLTVVSPLSGKCVTSDHSTHSIRGSIFYRFCEARVYYLLSSQIRFGYPLVAMFLPDSECLLRWHGQGDIQRRHLTMLTAPVDRQPAPDRPDARPLPAVLIGHRNFAHHMWNELSALENLLSRGCLDKPPQILAKREPLGALDDIFPELSNWAISRVGEDARPNGEVSLFVNLAGYRMSSGFRKRLVRHAIASVSETTSHTIDQMRRVNAPVFWLGVRTHKPTLVNQREVLSAIAHRLFRKYPSCSILLDGFSLPQDWRSTSNEMVQFYVSAVAASKREIDGILSEIKTTCMPAKSQMIVNAGGLGILDSIALAQVADAYFCHAGTMQHKIGWTTDAPGMIHANRSILATNPAERHTNRVDDGIRPVAIDEAMIEDSTKGGKNANYRVLDCDSLAMVVANFFERCLA